MNLTPRKLGKFYITEELFHQGWEKLLPIFRDLLVLEARYDFSRLAIEYVALSPYFRDINEGYEPLLYRIECMRDINGNITEVHWS